MFDLTNDPDGRMSIGPGVRSIGLVRIVDHRDKHEQRAGQDEWARAARWSIDSDDLPGRACLAGRRDERIDG